jgi:hypothetical protein
LLIWMEPRACGARQVLYHWATQGRMPRFFSYFISRIK